MTKTVYASTCGAKLDSHVHTGGGTDDTAALQRVLDTAADGDGVRLIMDGAALITGLTVYSNTTIECLNADCGFFLADGANCSLIRNAHPDFREIRDRNICLIGGTYTHNCLHQAHDIPTPPDQVMFNTLGEEVFRTRRFITALEFFGVEGLTVAGVTIRDQRTFAMLAANWKNVVVRDMQIDLPNQRDCENQDGLHFWGPGQFLTLQNIHGRSGDDFIALAPDEHDRVSSITDVLIDGVMLDHADQGIRLLSREKGRLDRVTIRNVTGTYRSFGFYINPWFPGPCGGNFGDIRIENVDLRPEEPNYTYRPAFLFQIGGWIEHLTLCHIRDHRPAHQRVLVEASHCSYDENLAECQCPTYIEQLTLEDFNVIRPDGLHTPLFTFNAAIDRLILRNFLFWCDEPGDSPVCQELPNGQIGLFLAENGLTHGVGSVVPACAKRAIVRNIDEI